MLDSLPPPKPGLWMPEKPAIIRPAEKRLLRPMSLMPVFSPLASAVDPITLAFTDSAETGEDTSTPSFLGLGVGSEKDGRVIIVAVHSESFGDDTQIAIVDINGSPTTEAVQSPPTFSASGIFYRQVPDGTTVDIDMTVLTSDNSGSRSTKVGVWTLTGAYDSLTPGSVDTDITNGTDMSVTVNEAVVIAIMSNVVSSHDGGAITWSGDVDNERYNGDIGEASAFSGIDNLNGGGTMSTSFSSTGNGKTMAAAGWR